MRYTVRPRGYWIDNTAVENEVSVTADQVIEQERDPMNTGLLDQNGDPIYRLHDTVPFGFRGKA